LLSSRPGLRPRHLKSYAGTRFFRGRYATPILTAATV
jgi:hypothetical protein